MTKRKQALIDDAKAAGYDVEIVERCGTVFFRRWSNHKDPSGRPNPRLLEGSMVLYGNGTAFSLLLHLSVAKGLRSYAQMRDLMNLPRR